MLLAHSRSFKPYLAAPILLLLPLLLCSCSQSFSHARNALPSFLLPECQNSCKIDGAAEPGGKNGHWGPCKPSKEGQRNDSKQCSGSAFARRKITFQKVGGRVLFDFLFVFNILAPLLLMGCSLSAWFQRNKIKFRMVKKKYRFYFQLSMLLYNAKPTTDLLSFSNKNVIIQQHATYCC